MAEKEQLRATTVKALALLPEGRHSFMEYGGPVGRAALVLTKGNLQFHTSVDFTGPSSRLDHWRKVLKEHFCVETGTGHPILVVQVDGEGNYCDLSQENAALFTSFSLWSISHESGTDVSTHAYFDSRQQARLKSEAEALVKIVLRKYQLGQCEYRAFFGGSACEAHHLMAHIIEADCGGLLLDTDLEKEGYGYLVVMRWSLVNKQ
jgi:hypothetical protein